MKWARCLDPISCHWTLAKYFAPRCREQGMSFLGEFGLMPATCQVADTGQIAPSVMQRLLKPEIADAGRW